MNDGQTEHVEFIRQSLHHVRSHELDHEVHDGAGQRLAVVAGEESVVVLRVRLPMTHRDASETNAEHQIRIVH